MEGRFKRHRVGILPKTLGSGRSKDRVFLNAQEFVRYQVAELELLFGS